MHILKIWIVSLFFLGSYFSEDLDPQFVLQCSGGVTDMVLSEGQLYVATDKGAVEVFSWPGKSKLFKVKLPPIRDFAGDINEAKIYSVDISPENEWRVYFVFLGLD